MKKVFSLIIITFLFLVSYGLSYSQILDTLSVNNVLKIQITDTVFEFNNKKNLSLTTRVKYLGSILTKDGNRIKLISYNRKTEKQFSGDCYLLIYDHKNKYSGYYDLFSILKFPDSLSNGKLYFSIKQGNYDCSLGLTSVIDLSNGLPDKFDLKCQNEDWAITTIEFWKRKE